MLVPIASDPDEKSIAHTELFRRTQDGDELWVQGLFQGHGDQGGHHVPQHGNGF